MSPLPASSLRSRITKRIDPSNEPNLAQHARIRNHSQAHEIGAQEWWDAFLRSRCEELLGNADIRGTIEALTDGTSDGVETMIDLAARVFLVQGPDLPDIEHQVETLRNDGLLPRLGETLDDDTRRIDHTHKQLIFALLGFVSMLYEPVVTADLANFTVQISRDVWNDPIPSVCLFQHQVPIRCASQAPYHMLKRFGYPLPPAPRLQLSGELLANTAVANKRSTLLSAPLVSYEHLTHLGKLKIEWTATLGYHLLLDKHAQIIRLFATPSFCHLVLTMDRAELVSLDKLYDELMCGALGRTEVQYFHIQEFMREILQTYQLIFGQDNRWLRIGPMEERAQLFASKSATTNLPSQASSAFDPLLRHLCTSTEKQQRAFYEELRITPPKSCYSTEVDFPHFEWRLLELQRYMSEVGPTGFWSLWRDRRDTLRFWTLWAVIIIGGLGLIASLWQAAVSTAALVIQVKAMPP